LIDCHRVLLVDEKLLDGTGLGSVYRYVDLVGLDGRDLLVLLNEVANLCKPSVVPGTMPRGYTHALTIASRFLL
jgi:hypothetical protein